MLAAGRAAARVHLCLMFFSCAHTVHRKFCVCMLRTGCDFFSTPAQVLLQRFITRVLNKRNTFPAQHSKAGEALCFPLPCTAVCESRANLCAFFAAPLSSCLSNRCDERSASRYPRLPWWIRFRFLRALCLVMVKRTPRSRWAPRRLLPRGTAATATANPTGKQTKPLRRTSPRDWCSLVLVLGWAGLERARSCIARLWLRRGILSALFVVGGCNLILI